MSNTNNVPKVYRNVIEEVIKNVKEAFLNEGVDEQVLQELKQIWENKLLQSRAVDGMPADQPPVRQQFMYPHIVQTNPAISAATQLTRQPQQQQITQRVAISHTTPSAGIPGTVTHRQPPPRQQTAIIFPDTHVPQQQTHIHALSQLTPAATAATLALPGIQQRPSGSGMPTSYPTARTIQVTQHLQQTQQQQQQQQQQQPGQQQVVTTQVQANKPPHMIIQVDGANDSDSDDGDDDDLGDDEDQDRNTSHEFEEEQEQAAEEEEPLNSEDDDSDDGATDLFDTENVVVCQFEKIARSRNKWKFHLKDGIMNVKGKDYIFHKATGEAEW